MMLTPAVVTGLTSRISRNSAEDQREGQLASKGLCNGMLLGNGDNNPNDGQQG